MNKSWVGILLFLTLGVIGCSDRGNKSNQDGKTVFRYNESAGISTLDPAHSARFEDVWAINHVFNGLVELDRSLNVVPMIAKRWELSEEGRKYTFYIRDDVYFHDDQAFPDGKGRKVVAADFVNSFYRIMDPETASQGKYIFDNIDMGERSDYQGIIAENDTTLSIYLKNPQNQFLSQLSLKYCSVIPIEAIEKYGREFRSHPVGTGPFKFKGWKEGVKLVLVKNEEYFEKDATGELLPYLDAVSISFVPDRHVEYLQFIRGKFEMISGLHASFKHDLLEKDGTLKAEHQDKIELQKSPWLKTDYIGILVDERIPITANSPLKRKKIRQAINYAINRKEIVKYIRYNIGSFGVKGIIPTGMPGYNNTELQGYEYNLDKVKKLVREAGFSSIADVPEIKLVVAKNYEDIAEFIQSQLTKAGFTLKVDVVPSTVHKQMVAQYSTNFFRKSWIADYPDPMNYLQLFYSKNFPPKGYNYTHLNNFYYDKFFEQAMIEENDSIRNDLFLKMEEIIIEEAPVVPLFYDEVVRFVQKNVTGLESNAMNMLSLKKVRLN